MTPFPAQTRPPETPVHAPRVLFVGDDDGAFRQARRALAGLFGKVPALDRVLGWSEAHGRVAIGAHDVYLVDAMFAGCRGAELIEHAAWDGPRTFILLTGGEGRDRGAATGAAVLAKTQLTPARLHDAIIHAEALARSRYALAQARERVREQAERYDRKTDELAIAERVARLATERAEDSERRLRILAERDPLTGIANRAVLASQLDTAIAHARRGRGVLALLFLNLDRFRRVNDTLGHAMGDKLIIAVAERLRGLVRKSDVVARLGGDEFAIMLTDMSNGAHAAGVAGKILAEIARPFAIDGRRVETRASVGIALLDGPDDTVETMLKKADAALFKAKGEGRGAYQFFDEAVDREVKRRLRLEADLPAAIAEDQLFLEYQPLVAADTGRVTAVEALVRWQHPELGRLPPDAFIPVAESSRLIVDLTRWVLRTACRQAADWRDRLPAPVPVHVNISAVDIASTSFARGVVAILDECGLDPSLLLLELTETSLLDPTRAMAEQLVRLNRCGVKIAIDDFGTGYSSLAHARTLPIDMIKVDRMFVTHMLEDRRDAAVVRAVVALAAELGVTAVIEGVEIESQLDYLRTVGGVDVQGYLISRPLGADAILSWLGAN